MNKFQMRNRGVGSWYNILLNFEIPKFNTFVITTCNQSFPSGVISSDQMAAESSLEGAAPPTVIAL